MGKVMSMLQCGSESYQKVALGIAIIDTICSAVLLILFVLGSSLMVAFEIVGKEKNATRVLDIVTDDVFGTVQNSYNTIREKKDVAEDMGVWLIVMFLTVADFIISCIFLDGVKSKNERKVQTWFNIRIVVVVVLNIIVLINLVYGTSFLTALPDLLYTAYRIFGLVVGYLFLLELRITTEILMSGMASTNTCDVKPSDSHKKTNLPIVTVTVTDDSTFSEPGGTSKSSFSSTDYSYYGDGAESKKSIDFTMNNLNPKL